MGIGGLITAVGTITAVLGIGVGAFAGIIAIITAVIAVIVYCITHWDQLKAKVQEVWSAISTYMSNLKEDITKKWNDIKQQIAEKIQSIKTDLQGEVVTDQVGCGSEDRGHQERHLAFEDEGVLSGCDLENTD